MADQPQAAPAQDAGSGVEQLISGVQQGLQKIAEGLSQAPSVPDAAKQALMQCVQAFGQFQQALEGGESPDEASQDSGTVPPEAGGQKVQPAL